MKGALRINNFKQTLYMRKIEETIKAKKYYTKANNLLL